MTEGLSKALISMGHEVKVILPFYHHLDRGRLEALKKVETFFDDEKRISIWSARLSTIPLLLVEIESKERYFNRGSIYGEVDDVERFATFTKVSLAYLLKKRVPLDVLHLHDWLTALGAPFYTEIYKPLGLQIEKVITSIHNMKYQGVTSCSLLERLGLKNLSKEFYTWLEDPNESSKINSLKGGLLTSDEVITVSPTYAKEIMGKEGYGLSPYLEGKLHGILNGIDPEEWNPERDPFLPYAYAPCPNRIEEALRAKQLNQARLKKMLGMRGEGSPLVISVTRLAEQKGPQLLRFGLEYTLQKGGAFILLCSTPESDLKETFTSLADAYKGHPNVYFHFSFDEQLAHLAFAAADSILIPSLFEPCGLTQMIALRYGALPIVHKVGGLGDTIHDVDSREASPNLRNGFTFDQPTEDALKKAMDRAFDLFARWPERWNALIKNGFSHDWSWKESSKRYLDLYKKE